MRDQLRIFVAAVRFLTRLPAPAWIGHHTDDLARSTVYFPVVGLIVGLFGAGIYWAAAHAWPPFIAVTLAVAGTIWLTGAFHEDALADAFDGLGGGWNKEQVLAIMKDSRIGSYGAVALIIAIALKLGTLTALPAREVVTALVAGHVLGRWSSLPLIWQLPYVRATAGTGKPFAASVTPARLMIGTAVTVGIVMAALGSRASAPLVTAVIVTATSALYFRRRLGGITGDCLGAANQLVEIATYLTLSFGVHGWMP